ncbi:MAG: hypothetical protein QOC81_4042 [Thermoanaerobaculia bacterium]|jgi:hypothetical protein|nr:hypothetical protein [Thermoanaerobaculia bacterium]
MPTLPLELHEVLEEEYVSMYGSLLRPVPKYSPADIKDERGAIRILAECGLPTDPNNLVDVLNALVDAKSPDSLRKLESSPSFTEVGKALLAGYDDYVKTAASPAEINRRIVDNAFAGAVRPMSDIRLDNVYAALHERAREQNKPRTALCISGGGIRSATFALGVMQGLASANILDKFDYLSTVSGGGYIGSWFSSWVRRHPKGVTGVQEDLRRADTAVAASTPAISPRSPTPVLTPRELPEKKLNPEPAPLGHLRSYSNYLSPRLGIFSGDTWTLASLYLRNLMLNLLVLVPLLAVALTSPRVFSWILHYGVYVDATTWVVAGVRIHFHPTAWAWLSAAFATIGFAYLGMKRPVEQGDKAQKKANTQTSDGHFLLRCVLPLTLSSICLAVFWARVAAATGSGEHDLLAHTSTKGAALLALLGMSLVPYWGYYRRMKKTIAAERRSAFTTEKEFRKTLRKKKGAEAIAIVLALATTAGLLILLAKKVFDDPLRAVPTVATLPPIDRAGVSTLPQSEYFVAFAVPLLLLVFFVQASIFVGLSSRHNEDSDREWWGRAGGWLLAISIGLALFGGIAVFGPVAFYYAPVILASVGGAAGLVAATVGYGDKSSANHQKEESTTEKAGSIGSALAVPLFIAALLASLSLGTTWLVQQFNDNDKTMVRAGTIENARLAMLEARYVAREPSSAGPQTLVNTSPRLSIPELRAIAHLQTIQGTSAKQVLIFLAVAGVAVLLSFQIGINKFSMNALYRNRIVRAYLGASRYSRDPDHFTGFDENDNIQMWQMRPELLWVTRLKSVTAFVDALKKGGADDRSKLGQYLWNALDDKTKERVAKGIDAISTDALVQNINLILLTKDLGDAGVKTPDWLTTSPKHAPYPPALRNRAILDSYFSDYLVVMTPPADAPNVPVTELRREPLHVVNMALNLTGGESLAWQQRMAESFTASAYHSGSLFLGYRPSRDYGGEHGISLGTAVSISGAAASPNMGYHSSPLMAFLLTFFNIRLGAWLGNPGPRGEDSFCKTHPDTMLIPLFSELTGNATDKSPWVYLSDGGHFENLALYEMVLRRCHNIVVSDGGADPKCTFEDLGNAIRKIRTDLGVPIDIAEIKMFPRTKDGAPAKGGEYVAFGTIRYSAVDKNAVDGSLIYIKPGVYEGQYFPRDVYNYCQESIAFPHEPTSDQFFSESQFESYRALGRHAVNEICKNYPAAGTKQPRIPIANTYASVADFVKHISPPEPL